MVSSCDTLLVVFALDIVQFAAVLSVLKGLIIVPVGTMGPSFSRLCLRSRAGRARAPRIPRFILVVSSCHILLVVFTLDN